MLTLRDYQQVAINTIKSASRVKSEVLTVAPCAAGKTVLMSVLSDWICGAGKRVLVLMDRQNLVLQTYARFLEYFPALGFLIGVACKTVSERIDYDADILIASRQTLAPRIAELLRTGRIKPFNAIIIDEVHNCPIINNNSVGAKIAHTEKSDTGNSTELKPPSDLGSFQALAYSIYKSIVQQSEITNNQTCAKNAQVQNGTAENTDKLGLNSCISSNSSRQKNTKQSENQYHVIIQALREAHPATRIFGFTATPYRFSGEIYGENKLFSAVDYRITTAELIKREMLTPLKWKVSQSDISDKLKSVKRSSTGELNESEHQAIVTQPVYLKECLLAYQEHCSDRKTVIFALNIPHAEMLGEAFREAGIRTWVLHSKNELKTEEVVKEFERNDGVLINVGKLTIGSDIPCIRAIILARRVMSTALFFQMVGRGGRLYPDKTDCLILDLTGNAFIHGNDPDNPIIQITGREGKVKKDPPIKLCPMCDSIVPRNARICPECKNFEWTPDECEVKELTETKKPVRLIDFEGGKVTLDIFRIELNLHESLKKLQSVRVDFYYSKSKSISAWYFPEHQSKFLSGESGRAWIALGGKYATPKTNQEWLARQSELRQECKITVDLSGKFPKVKKIV